MKKESKQKYIWKRNPLKDIHREMKIKLDSVSVVYKECKYKNFTNNYFTVMDSTHRVKTQLLGHVLYTQPHRKDGMFPLAHLYKKHLDGHPTHDTMIHDGMNFKIFQWFPYFISNTMFQQNTFFIYIK